MAKHKRRIMNALKINEISMVDVPAQEGAVAVIMKRKGEPGYDPNNKDPRKRGRAPDENFDKTAALTSPEDGHSHLLVLDGGHGDFNSGETSWVDGHVHPWVRAAGGEIIIGTSHSPDGDAHIHRVAVTSKSEEENAGKAGDVVGQQEDTTMTDKTKKAADETATVEELQAQLAHANLMGSLSDAEKAHYEALKALGDEAEAKAFLSKSTDERDEILKAEIKKAEKHAKDEDPVEYTTLDGIELRKSAGAAFIAMAKSNDDLRKRLDKSESAREQDTFEKRAEDELSHLPGTAKERAALLKATEGIEDEDMRKAAMNALKAQNTALSTAFVKVGHGGGAQPASGSPDDELDTLAKAHQKENPGMSYEVAYDAVLKTDQGHELYAKSVN